MISIPNNINIITINITEISITKSQGNNTRFSRNGCAKKKRWGA
ncbi:hypothetical protein MNV_270009 [Candidatus Methanoperedens nitroreducens]|uniref:Uncharacterized protein n=1 Tax=Candidatus Methanoperedens nitratireducens TaxID=1392998 RepID=A0A284VPM5_9EURY|nr:hypothetical protein MNV_270009 [Candidatus Methanoperedens nitroreducens]